MSEHAVEATGLAKSYGETEALRGIDFHVRTGSVLGTPGWPGSTSPLKAAEVHKCIGPTGQYAAADEHLTGAENLTMIARLNGLTRPDAQVRTRQLLDRFGLTDAGGRPTRTYSSGMRRRLDLAASLVSRPEVLFLDEPTTGLDPASRLSSWAVIREIVADGTTVLLSTQYLEEADELTDEILVIDHGLAIARGTSRQLKDQVGGERIEFTVAAPSRTAETEHPVVGFSIGDVSVDHDSGAVSFPVDASHDHLADTVRALDDAGIRLDELSLRRASLNDVFLSLTGRTAEGSTDEIQVAS